MSPTPPSQLRPYLQLLRLPNLFTALADILAGYFFSAPAETRLGSLVFLLLASASLYTGGIVLNDYFDYATDCRERPERPLPAGQIRRSTAGWLGFLLLIFGFLCAAMAGSLSALIAAALVGLILAYDAVTKNIPILGSANMGACRFFNFFLGMSLAPLNATLLLVPLLTWIYVFAITSLSKGEVGGGSRWPAARSLVLLLIVVVWFMELHRRQILPNGLALPALAIFAAIFFLPVVRALIRPEASRIGRAVKYLVLGLIPLNATITLAATDWQRGLLVLLLLLPALFLAKFLYVT